MGKRGGGTSGKGQGKAKGGNKGKAKADSAATLLASLPPELRAQVQLTLQSGPMPNTAAATPSLPGAVADPGGLRAAVAGEQPQLAGDVSAGAESKGGLQEGLKQEKVDGEDVATDGGEEKKESVEAAVAAPFNFAQEVLRQARAPASSSASNMSAVSVPGTPDVATVYVDDETDGGDLGCDPGMCGICLVVPKQSSKKRYCRDHQQCFECIERASFKGVDKKQSPMQDSAESTAYKQIFGWRGNEPKFPGQPRLANKIVGLFVLALALKLVYSKFSKILIKELTLNSMWVRHVGTCLFVCR